MECFGILRFAQDDSKDLQWQEQSNAEDNSKSKNKIKNKDKRQELKQTRAKTKANAGVLRSAQNDSEKTQPQETHSKKLTTANTDSGSAPIYRAGRLPF